MYITPSTSTTTTINNIKAKGIKVTFLKIFGVCYTLCVYDCQMAVSAVYHE